MVINEAKALRVPVISNDFPSVSESLRDGIDGIICTLEDMPETINKMINNPMQIDFVDYYDEAKDIVCKFEVLLGLD